MAGQDRAALRRGSGRWKETAHSGQGLGNYGQFGLWWPPFVVCGRLPDEAVEGALEMERRVNGGVASDVVRSPVEVRGGDAV